MRGPVFGAHLFVVVAACVPVTHQESDGGTKGKAILNTGKDLDLVGFVAVAGDAALTRPATIQLGLNFVSADAETRGTTVDHDAHARAVRFAPGCDAEEFTKGTCHDWVTR